MSPAELAAELRRIRTSAGLTQVKLARLIKIEQPSLSAAERGRAMPAMATLLAWLDACSYDLVFRARPVAGGLVARDLTAEQVALVDAAADLPAEDLGRLARVARALHESSGDMRRKVAGLIDIAADLPGSASSEARKSG